MTVAALNRLAYSDVVGPDPESGELIERFLDTRPSEPIPDAKPECGHPPSYQLTYSITKKEQLRLFPPSNEPNPRNFWYEAVSGRSRDAWVGTWVFPPSAVSPTRVSCDVTLSLSPRRTLSA